MKQYRNSERTKKWIRRAFTELLAEKRSINKITVSELAERADVTKTTFYYHYEDIYAVAEEFENELIAELDETLADISKENPQDYSAYIKRLLSFIKEHEESYRLAAKGSELSLFTEKLKNIFTKKIVAMSNGWGFSSDYDKRAVQVYFLGSACVDTIIRYLKDGFNVPLETVGDVVIEAIEKLKKD